MQHCHSTFSLIQLRHFSTLQHTAAIGARLPTETIRNICPIYKCFSSSKHAHCIHLLDSVELPSMQQNAIFPPLLFRAVSLVSVRFSLRFQNTLTFPSLSLTLDGKTNQIFKNSPVCKSSNFYLKVINSIFLFCCCFFFTRSGRKTTGSLFIFSCTTYRNRCCLGQNKKAPIVCPFAPSHEKYTHTHTHTHTHQSTVKIKYYLLIVIQ